MPTFRCAVLYKFAAAIYDGMNLPADQTRCASEGTPSIMANVLNCIFLDQIVYLHDPWVGVCVSFFPSTQHKFRTRTGMAWTGSNRTTGFERTEVDNELCDAWFRYKFVTASYHR